MTKPDVGRSSRLGIQLEALSLHHGGQRAVGGLSGHFPAGSLTAVVGPNGAGKSSLLQALAGQLRPSAGKLEIPTAWQRRTGWLPQQAGIDRSFPLTAFDFVALGCWARMGAFRALGAALREQAHAALAAVGLSGCERRPIAALSEGQFQRLRFARLLLQDAPLILLDEPFNAVDADTAALLLEQVLHWHVEGRTVVAVLHDLSLVRARFSDCLLLARRAVAWSPTAEVLLPTHLDAARQQAQSWDRDALMSGRAGLDVR